MSKQQGYPGANYPTAPPYNPSYQPIPPQGGAMPPPAYNQNAIPPNGYAPPPYYPQAGAVGPYAPQPPQYTAAPAPYSFPPAQTYVAGPGQVPVYATASAHFDSGARFDGIARQAVPPPPPGVAPNAAQLAAMQGRPVVVEQKKDNFFSGGSGAGYTFW